MGLGVLEQVWGPRRHPGQSRPCEGRPEGKVGSGREVKAQVSSRARSRGRQPIVPPLCLSQVVLLRRLCRAMG